MHLQLDLHEGDNLAHLWSLGTDSVDLVATDPPYNTGKEWRAGAGRFNDQWGTREAFLDYMRERAVEMWRVLKPDGALYWQCDPNISLWLRLMLNEVFGESAFVTEIYWKRTQSGHGQALSWGKVVDIILCYGEARIDKCVNEGNLTEAYRKRFRHTDEHGLYDKVSVVAPKAGEVPSVPWNGYDPAVDNAVWRVPAELPPWFDEPGWRESTLTEKLDTLLRLKLLVYPKGSKRPRLKYYLSQCAGAPPTNLWDDIKVLQSGSMERTGYPTQKPVALYERIVLASSPPGGVVLDPFCGSGTTGVAAVKHGRSFIGMDSNPEALALTRRRLKEAAVLL